VHAPGRQAALAGERASGGRAKATAARAERLLPVVLRPVLNSLLAAVGEVRDGTLPPARAQALAALAGAIVRTFQVGLLEERLAALEQAAEVSEGRTAT